MPKTILAAALLALSVPAHALAQDDPEWRQLAALGFGGVDGDGNGEATLPEQIAYVEAVHASMDGDEDGALSEAEFTSWGFGMVNIAEDRGTLPAYRAGLRIIFDLWDRNADERLIPSEHEAAVVEAFVHADADGNGVMNEAEYTDRFVYNVVSRNALRTD